MKKHFKSVEAFRKNAAFVHIHGIPHRGQRDVIIGGHDYKIKHPHNMGYCFHCGQMH